MRTSLTVTFLVLSTLAATPAQDGDASLTPAERDRVRRMRAARTPEEARRNLGKLAEYRSDGIVRVVAQVARDAGPKGQDLAEAAVHVLVEINTSMAWRSITQLGAELAAGPLRDHVVRATCAAAIAKGNEAALEVLEGMLAATPASRELAPVATKALIQTLPYHPERLAALAARGPGVLRTRAEAEIARLRAFDPSLPIVDLSRLERWKKERVQELERWLQQDRDWSKGNPRQRVFYARRIAQTNALRERVGGARLVDIGADALGEYYDATAQTAAAVRAVVACKELAGALEDLPAIEVERTHGYVDRRGEFHVDGVDGYTIDLGALASDFFTMASAQSAVDAVRAREIARRNVGMLSSLSRPTQGAIRAKYVERLSRNAQIQAARARRQKAGR